MNKKVKMIWGIVILIVLLGGIAIVRKYNNESSIAASISKINTENNDSSKLTKEQINTDSKQIIEIMESTHPFFILEGETEKYKQAKAKFLNETNKSLSKEDFEISVSKYLSSIQDGHTRVEWNEAQWLDVKWKYINSKLVILDDANKVTDKVVTKINGIDIERIFHNIDELFPAENYVAVAENYEVYSKSKKVLIYSSVDCSKDIILSVNTGTSEENIPVKLSSNLKEYSGNYEISSKQIDDKTIYVRFSTCVLNKDLDKLTEDLKQALDKGTKNVIIDVMDNPGGNSDACNKLLDSLKITPGQFGSVVRFSPLAQKQYGYKSQSGFKTYDGSNDVVSNPNINLYIIMDEGTFSSAQWLATWVKDGRLGTLVGRPSSNMPSSYGDVLQFQLNNSNLKGQISYKKWTRPDKTKDSERVLEPDVHVDYSENALNKVLELIAAKEKNK